MNNNPTSDSRASIRRHIIIGCAVVAFLAIGLGGWASTAEISGALIAQGSLVVDSNVKKVQHPTGGVVGEVRVHDGDRVKAGEILIRLDETVTRANLAIVTKGLTELYARKARLVAELNGAETVAAPKEFAGQLSDPEVQDTLASERKLFDLRRTTRLGEKDQLRQRIKELQEQISGLVAQEDAESKNCKGCAICGRRILSSSAGSPRSNVKRRACRASAASSSPAPRKPRAKSSRPSCKSSRSIRTSPATSPRNCATPTARSANTSSAR